MEDEKTTARISERPEDEISAALVDLAMGAANMLLYFEGTAAENAARELVAEELRCIEAGQRLAEEIV